MKTFFLAAAFCMITCLCFANFDTAEAQGLAPGTCTLDQVGTMQGQNFIYATCPTAGYDNKFFRINDPYIKKELLATALTAISLGSDVRLWIEADGSTCSRIYIMGDTD